MKRIVFFIAAIMLLYSCQKDEIVPDALMSASEKSIKPKIKKDLIDYDGNVYKTVKIGKQVWMAENLKTTRYNDGTEIPNLESSSDWVIEDGTEGHNGAYCWFENEIINKDTYGALYNWYTVQTGKLCPTGWHVPSDLEWTTLTTYLGGESVAGGKLKETGTIHWHNPNTGATNETGFTALPGSNRDIDGFFINIGYDGYFWSSNEYNANNAIMRYVDFSVSDMTRSLPYKKNGFSVRCIMD